MMDRVHGRLDATARKRFNDHKSKMVEGRHCFVLNSDEAVRLCGVVAPNGLTVLTERGYLVLVKSFTDDLAWQVQEQLVDGYLHAQFMSPALPAGQLSMGHVKY